MVNKALCTDFADMIVAHFDYKLGLDTFVTTARNIITALVFDKTISEAEIPLTARYMLERVAEGFGLDNKQVDEISSIFPSLSVEFDAHTIGPIISSVNAGYCVGPNGEIDYSKMTAENMLKNGYELVALTLMRESGQL